MKPPHRPCVFRDELSTLWIAAVPCRSGVIGEYYATTHDRALWMAYRMMWEYWGNGWWK